MDRSRGRQTAAAWAEFCARAPQAGSGPAAGPDWVLDLFHQAAGSVPAYQDFLRGHGVEPAEVRALADFGRLPLMTKENYHTRYPLPQRCRAGRLDGCDMIAVSSGSTGRPSYWPRTTV